MPEWQGFFQFGCQNGRLPKWRPGVLTYQAQLPPLYYPSLARKPQSTNTACNSIETIVSYIRCTNTIFAENGDAMNKDEPIEIETVVKVIAGCVLPEPELLAPTPPIEQALADIEENIIKDD